VCDQQIVATQPSPGRTRALWPWPPLGISKGIESRETA